MKPCKITVDLYNTFRERMPEYVQYDRNVPLEITVLENGKPARLDGLFGRLLASKPDGHEIYSNDVEMNGNVITTILGEQIFTASGIVKITVDILDEQNSKRALVPFEMRVRSAVITDESIKSSSDYQTITALISDVRALDTMFQEGQDVIYEAKEIVGTLTDLNAIASESEEKRQADELNRVSKELIRVAEEEQRVTNEEQRVANEETRITNEEQRVANEQDRVTNETNRRIAENTRIAQERARQDAELQRNAIFEENEDLRKEGEKERVANENKRKAEFDSWEVRETVRLKSEENRIIQEGERVENETQRQQQEETRQQQEETRQQTYTAFNDAEVSRIASEQQRQLAEEKRKVAEAERQANYVNRENTRDQQYAMAEQTRDNAFTQNEANRQLEYTQAERERVESEELRKSYERERQTAEAQRQTQEQQRVQNEQGRIDRFNQEIESAEASINEVKTNATSDINSTKSKAESAIAEVTNNAIRAIETTMANADEIITEAESTMQGIEDRAEACLPIIEDSATAKVDYMGNEHKSIKDARDADVDWLLGEINAVHYDGQHITATDTIEGRSKSAILKGQTLVNLCPNKAIDYTATSDWDGFNALCQNSRTQESWRVLQDLKPNTKYFVSCYVETFNASEGQIYRLNNPTNTATVFKEILEVKAIGLHKWVLTSRTEFTEEISIALRCQNYNARGAIKIRDIMIIEYQDGMENWDIPYFEGMQSVKMPGLTTVGKNLFDGILEDGMIDANGNLGSGGIAKRSVNYIKVKPKTTYTLSCSNGYTHLYIHEYDSNYNNIAEKSSNTFTTENNTMYIKFNSHASLDLGNPKIQLEEYSQATPYEPYKSNTLTANEDIVLRGIGNVKDELNVATGELTQHIKEVVFDGSDDEGWTFSEMKGDNYRFGFNLKTDVYSSADKTPMLCDKWTVGNIQTETTQEQVAIYNHTDYMELRLIISPNKLTSNTGQALKDYLKANPFTIQYALATPVVKTVDLSDNHVYSYKDVTHYDCSSAEGSLVPTLSIDVPTNLPAVVARQRATIQELEKENVALKTAVTIVDEHREEGDLELLSSDFDFELRLMEIEFAIGIPMMANYKGVRNMARTPYDMAKALILGGKYEREEMIAKLDRFEKLGSITADQKAELIALMDAIELTQ